MRESEELLQFVYLMPVAVLRLGATGAVELLNPKAVQLLQDLDMDDGSGDGALLLDRLCPGLQQLWRDSAGHLGTVTAQRISAPRPGREALHLVLELVRPDERCTMLVLQDVTLVVDQERDLARARRRMNFVLENIHGYCVLMLDARGIVFEWNPSIGRMFGGAESDVIGRSVLRGIATDVQPSGPALDFETIRQAVARQGWCHVQSPWRRFDGGLLWGDCMVTGVVDPDGATSGYVAVIRDTTEEHERSQKLRDDAWTDPLTGLHNRRGFEARADALRSAQSGAPALLTLIMIDIDHFKAVNDSFGHEGGDEVLKGAAISLQSTLREDDILARYGGEEFVLLLPGASEEVGAAVAERLRLKLQALTIAVGGRQTRVTASFGVAQQALGETRAATFERADAALYRAKHEGRNRVIITLPEPGLLASRS
jgi:diguanylate cyclase (GGDEF)-like protein/PAS domain S-box-containing protein